MERFSPAGKQGISCGLNWSHTPVSHDTERFAAVEGAHVIETFTKNDALGTMMQSFGSPRCARGTVVVLRMVQSYRQVVVGDGEFKGSHIASSLIARAPTPRSRPCPVTLFPIAFDYYAGDHHRRQQHHYRHD